MTQGRFPTPPNPTGVAAARWPGGPARVSAARACAQARALGPAPPGPLGRPPPRVLPQAQGEARARSSSKPRAAGVLGVASERGQQRPSAPPTLRPAPAGPARKVREPPRPAGQTDNRNQPEACGGPCKRRLGPASRFNASGPPDPVEAAAAPPRASWGGTCGAAGAAS